MNIEDYTEFEAKFYPVNKEDYRKKLLSIGAKLTIPERKMIRVVASGQANPNFGTHQYIRVRDEGNVIRLSLKVMAKEGGELGDQKEIDVEVSDFDKTVKIIEATGIKFNRRQETLREEWSYDGAQITIDSWPGLDVYSEIEGNSEEQVKEIAEKLDFVWDKKIIMAAGDLYAKVYNMDLDEVRAKISDLTFENNPFAKFKKVWAPKTQQE